VSLLASKVEVGFSHLTLCPTGVILTPQVYFQAGRKMTAIVKNPNFTRISKSVKPDTKKRVILPKELVGEDVVFHVYSNASGQILLDPQVTIPASEAWLFKNPDILKLAQKGLSDVAEGKVSRVNLDTL
jgi:hypothetical protein